MDETSLDLQALGNLESGTDIQKWIEILQIVSLGINILYIVVFIATSYGLYTLSKRL